MAKSAKTFSTARVLFLLAFLLTAFFIFHVSNFSSVFDKNKTTDAIGNLRKQNVVTKPNPPAILNEHDHHNVVDFDQHPKEEPVHPAGTPPSVNVEEAMTDKPQLLHTHGFVGHNILLLSDEELGSTPISTLMSTYGEADGGGSCSQDFGNELVNRWRKLRSRYCGASDADLANKPSSSLATSMDCHLVRQTRHHGNGDQLCLYHNVVVNMALFDNEELTTKVVQEYVHTMHAHQPYIQFPQGFIQGDCDPARESWSSRFQPGWNTDLTVGAYKYQSSLSKEECDLWIDHPVLITERDTFANFFHDSEDFVNVFLAMAILEWKKEDTQMFLTDLYPEGPFWEMWSKVYSSGNGQLPAMTAWDLKKKFRSIGGGLSGTNKICFKNLAVGIYGPAAPITVASWDTPCKKTALVRAYSDYVIRGLNLQHLTHYASEQPSKTITVTYMARRPSKEWPERKYCNSTDSFFTCSYWDNFGARNLGRMVRNDAEVVQALKSLERVDFKDGRKVKVQDVDYNILNFEQQISIDLGTDIMIGAHGAGLMHNIFMRDRATLIELFVDGSSVNRHFHNLAFWYGRNYNGVPIQNPIDVDELIRIVTTEIRNIDINAY